MDQVQTSDDFDVLKDIQERLLSMNANVDQLISNLASLQTKMDEFTEFKKIVNSDLKKIEGFTMNQMQEILYLWFEITFERKVMNHILSYHPSIKECITQKAVDVLRKEAQDFVSERFPTLGVKFTQNVEQKEVIPEGTPA